MARIRAHLSYANVMATIALFLALCGGAYASLSGKDKKRVRAIADQEIAAQAPGLSVANAVSAANATNAANADKLDQLDSTDIGLGFLTGRVDTLALTGSTGNAPSGVSASTTDTTLANQDMTLSPSRSILMRNFRVTLSQALGCGGLCGPTEDGVAHLEAFAPGSGSVTASLSCNILTTQTTCIAAGPSATVPPGSSLRVSFSRTGDAQYDTGTDALFSWQATAG